MRVLCVEAGWRRAKGVDDRLRRLLGRVGVAVAGEALTTCDGGGAEAVETHAQRAPALGLERRDAQVACAQAGHVMRHLVRGVGIPLEDSERHPAAAAVDASVDRVAADPLQPPLARSVGAPRLTAALLVAFEVQDLPEGPLVLPVRLEVPPRAPLDRIHLAGLRFLLERLPASLERGTRSAAAEVAREELPAKVRRAPPPLAPDRRVLPRRRLAPLRRDVREEAVTSEVDLELGGAGATVLEHVPRAARVVFAHERHAKGRARVPDAHWLQQLAAYATWRFGGRSCKQHRPLAARAELVELTVRRGLTLCAGSSPVDGVLAVVKDLLDHRLELEGCRQGAIAGLLQLGRGDRVLRKERGHFIPRVRIPQ